MEDEMTGKNLFAIAAICATTGCTGLQYAADNYTGVPVQNIKHAEKEWRIFDKPDQGRLMITPSLSDSAADGFASGLTLGLAGSPYLREATFRPAVEAYLSQVHGRCAITHGDLVVKPQFEFFYDC